MLGAVLPDVGGVYTGVTDADQAPAPHLALLHVQQEAELALLPTGVTAAPPCDEPPDVSLPLPACLLQPGHPEAVPGDVTAVEFVPAG